MTTWLPADEFSAQTLYLNTASMGLPPRTTREALAASLCAWSDGRAAASDYDAAVASARSTFATLVHVPQSWVAVGHQVSPLVGLFAAAVPDGSTVLTAEGEFTSLTFPFAAHAARGVTVKAVPLHDLSAWIGADTAVVAISSVQSATGEIAPLTEIEAAATLHGAEIIVDLTQSAGWFDVDASRYAVTVTAGYKWLLSPRGTAFMTVRPDVAERLRPLSAGWYAGADVWSSIYGLPLRLATDARRFDVSPAWHSWVGTDASLRFLAEIGVRALHDHAMEVAGAFKAAAGLAPATSAILSLHLESGAAEVIDRLEVMAAQRAGRTRLSFHVNNTVDEVERLGAALRGLVHDQP